MRRDEQLSALMDNQLQKDELRFLLKGLENDDDARAKWGRYHQIGDVLRGESNKAVEVDISAQVMAEIEQLERQPEKTEEPAWMKRVVQFAMVASVATVAVFVANDRGFIGAAAPTASLQTVPALTASNVDRSGGTAEWEQVSPAAQARIQQLAGNQGGASTSVDVSVPVQLVGHKEALDEEQASDEDIEVEQALEEGAE